MKFNRIKNERNGVRLAIVGLIGVLATTGCASIIHGTRQSVYVTSEPSGATVWVNGASHGKTPATTSLKRKEKNQVIEVRLDGYEPYRVELQRKLSGWYFGNLVFGGIIGLIVDPINGAMYKLTPKQIDAHFGDAVSNINPTPDGGEDTLVIAVTLAPDPAWQRIGTLTPAGDVVPRVPR